MKTILVLTAGGVVAHIVRPLEVGLVLQEMGYRVVFAGGEKGAAYAAQHGWEFKPLCDHLDLSRLRARIWEGPRALHVTEAVAEAVEAEIALLHDLRPDAVLQDFRITASTSTAVTGTTLISLGNAYLTPYAVNGLLSRSWPGVPPSLLGPGAEEAYNEVRRRYGVPEVPDTLRLFVGDLNLMCDVPEYAPVQDAPDSFHYVGPIVWDGASQMPPWLAELRSDRPTLYFTMGSSGSPEAFRAAIEAFGGSEHQVLVTTGGVVSPEDLGPLPPNFRITRFAPGSELVRRAHVVICHGGNGTSYQALSQGVPIIACPSLADQRWNAQRLAELGCGTILPATTPSAMREAVAELLGNAQYATAARRFKDILAQWHGPATAGQWIDRYLTRGL